MLGIRFVCVSCFPMDVQFFYSRNFSSHQQLNCEEKFDNMYVMIFHIFALCILLQLQFCIFYTRFCSCRKGRLSVRRKTVLPETEMI